MTGADAPWELEMVTVIEPIADTFPEIGNGMAIVNWLPNAVEAALAYQAVNVLERFKL